MKLTTNIGEKTAENSHTTNRADDGVSSQAPKCANCNFEIKEKTYTKVLDRCWHNSCFKCCACRSRLDSKCFTRDGFVFCQHDFQSQAWYRCSGCNRNICPDELVQRIHDYIFHVSCLVCSVCGCHLQTGDKIFIVHGYPCKVYCDSDYRQHVIAQNPNESSKVPPVGGKWMPLVPNGNPPPTKFNQHQAVPVSQDMAPNVASHSLPPVPAHSSPYNGAPPHTMPGYAPQSPAQYDPNGYIRPQPHSQMTPNGVCPPSAYMQHPLPSQQAPLSHHPYGSSNNMQPAPHSQQPPASYTPSFPHQPIPQHPPNYKQAANPPSTPQPPSTPVDSQSKRTPCNNRYMEEQGPGQVSSLQSASVSGGEPLHNGNGLHNYHQQSQQQQQQPPHSSPHMSQQAGPQQQQQQPLNTTPLSSNSNNSLQSSGAPSSNYVLYTQPSQQPQPQQQNSTAPLAPHVVHSAPHPPTDTTVATTNSVVQVDANVGAAVAELHQNSNYSSIHKTSAPPGLNLAGGSAFSPCSSQSVTSQKPQPPMANQTTPLLHAVANQIPVTNQNGVSTITQQPPQGGFKHSSVNGDDEKSSDNLSVCSENDLQCSPKSGASLGSNSGGICGGSGGSNSNPGSVNSNNTTPPMATNSTAANVSTPTSSSKRGPGHHLKGPQADYLRQYYVTNQKPSKEEREAIAANIGLEAKTIAVWFQNRRSKEKIKRDKAAAAAANAQSSSSSSSSSSSCGDSGVIANPSQSPATIQSPGSVDSQCSNSNFALNASGNPPPASSSSGTYLLDNATGSSSANVAGAGVSSMGGAPVVDTNSTSVVSATPVQPPDYSMTPQDSPSVGMAHMGAGGPLVEMETNVSTPQNSNGVGGPFINESDDNNRLFPMDFQTINGPTNVTSGPPPTAAPAVAPNLTNHLPVVPAPNHQGMVVTSAIDASVNVPLSTTQAFRGTEPSGVAPSVATPPPVQNHTNVYQQQQPPSHLIPAPSVLSSSNFALTPDYPHPNLVPPPTSTPVAPHAPSQVYEANKQPVLVTQQPLSMPVQSQDNGTMQYYDNTTTTTHQQMSDMIMMDNSGTSHGGSAVANVNNNALLVSQPDFGHQSNFAPPATKNWSNLAASQTHAVHPTALNHAPHQTVLQSLHYPPSSTPPVTVDEFHAASSNNTATSVNQLHPSSNQPTLVMPPPQVSQSNLPPPPITPGSAN